MKKATYSNQFERVMDMLHFAKHTVKTVDYMKVAVTLPSRKKVLVEGAEAAVSELLNLLGSKEAK